MRSVSVADSGGTIDPNDLDSIDALLDEAELEAAEEEPTVEDLSESDSDDNFEGDDRKSTSDDELDSIPEEPKENVTEEKSLDEFDEDLEPRTEPEPESDIDLAQQKEINENPVEKVAEPGSVENDSKKPVEASVTEDHAEHFLQKRASVQKKEPSNLTVAEMDSIKKLIIIFSSTIIFLVVAAIGIGLWGALSSGGGLDDETMTLMKDTHEGAMQSMVKSSATEEAVKQVGKKLDALSFQLEQLNSDLLQVKDVVTVAPMGSKSTAAVLDLQNEQTGKSSNTAVSNAAPITTNQVAVDSGVSKKIDKVNAQVVVTQRRLSEVNDRVKQLQKQYQTFLKSLKELEKAQLKGQSNMSDLLEATKAQIEADKLKQQTMQKSRYEYSAPNSPFFDYVR